VEDNWAGLRSEGPIYNSDGTVSFVRDLSRVWTKYNPEPDWAREDRLARKQAKDALRRRIWRERIEVEAYPFTDENGVLLYEHVRYSIPEPLASELGRSKTFGYRDPRYPVYFPEHHKKPPGVDDYLYRLPEILKAVDADEDVHLCEGEKDANALWDWGIAAATNGLGACKGSEAQMVRARLAEGSALRVIWMDKDGPNRDVGAKDAWIKWQALLGAGCSDSRVMIVKARHPKDKDAYDHLDRYGLDVKPIRVSKKKLAEMSESFAFGSTRRASYAGDEEE
jgi:hypothetical protein